MTKLKISTARIRTSFHIRLVFALLFAVIFIVEIRKGVSTESVLPGIGAILFAASAAEYYFRFIKKSEGKSFIEIKINTERAIKTRAIIGAVCVLAIIYLYFKPLTENIFGVFEPNFVIIGLLAVAALMIVGIYKLKKLSKK